MPQIMEMEIFDTTQLHRATKRTSKMAIVKQGERVTREHVVTLERPHLGFSLEDIEQTVGSQTVGSRLEFIHWHDSRTDAPRLYDQ